MLPLVCHSGYLRTPNWKTDMILWQTHDRLEASAMSTIVNMECKRHDGFCLSRTNDCWPFQINIVHYDMYRSCLFKIRHGEKEALFREQLTFALAWFRRHQSKMWPINTKVLAKSFFKKYNWSNGYANRAILLREFHKRDFRYLKKIIRGRFDVVWSMCYFIIKTKIWII